MKKDSTPEMEITEFEIDDVITTSGTGEGGSEDEL